MEYSEKRAGAAKEVEEVKEHTPPPLTFQQNVVLMIKIFGVAGVIFFLIWFLDQGMSK